MPETVSCPSKIGISLPNHTPVARKVGAQPDIQLSKGLSSPCPLCTETGTMTSLLNEETLWKSLSSESRCLSSRSVILLFAVQMMQC